jgi:hypothetical protein
MALAEQIAEYACKGILSDFYIGFNAESTLFENDPIKYLLGNSRIIAGAEDRLASDLALHVDYVDFMHCFVDAYNRDITTSYHGAANPERVAFLEANTDDLMAVARFEQRDLQLCVALSKNWMEYQDSGFYGHPLADDLFNGIYGDFDEENEGALFDPLDSLAANRDLRMIDSIAHPLTEENAKSVDMLWSSVSKIVAHKALEVDSPAP